MRRSASEIIRNLEKRVARLERQATTKFKRTWDRDEFPPQDVMEDLASLLAKDLKKAGIRAELKLYRGKVPVRFMVVKDAEKFLLSYLSDNRHAGNARHIYNKTLKTALVYLYGVEIELSSYDSSRDELTLSFYQDDYHDTF